MEISIAFLVAGCLHRLSAGHDEEVLMNDKKSMRIFWLTLCLLLAAGTVIIAAVWYRSHKNGTGHASARQQAEQPAADSSGTDDTQDAAVSFAVQPQIRKVQPSGEKQPAAGTDTVEYRFELKVKDGYLDVYHYHTENLFFHTGVPYSAMSVRQRQELEQGKYFVNEQELYGYLESCTS